MKKKSQVILALVMILMLSGCNHTTPSDDIILPPMDNGSFTNFVPWWSTNSLDRTNDNRTIEE